jgi:hypothetical protein
MSKVVDGKATPILVIPGAHVSEGIFNEDLHVIT